MKTSQNWNQDVLQISPGIAFRELIVSRHRLRCTL